MKILLIFMAIWMISVTMFLNEAQRKFENLEKEIAVLEARK